MGVFSRPDSKYWWLWLETAPKGQQKVRTDILIGFTITERKASKESALEVYAARMLKAGRQAHQLPTEKATTTFRDYSIAYDRDVISHHKGLDREREILAVLRLAFDACDLRVIDRDSVRTWMTERKASGVAARTINREVDLLKAMLRDAVPKYLEASPLSQMPRLKTIKPRRRVLSADEERRLLKACEDAQDTALLTLGIDTLQRMGDLLDLRRTDRRGQWIYIRDTKNSDALEVPLSPRASKALDAITHEQSYYFEKFRRAVKPRDWRSSVRQRLEYLCEKAGVPFGQAQNGVTFHWATRRTGATKLVVRKRVPIPVAQRLGNWSKPGVLLEIYTDAQRSDLAKAVGQLPARSRKASKTKKR